MYKIKNLDQAHFLKHCWQKKPLVIKQGFEQFQDPLDEHLLAGLTEEESVDSRIISFSNNSWQVDNGPFDDINQHCVGAWSLLVQAVDHFIPEGDELLRAFDFIPHWRMDDLMVSYSNHGAGVGPHLDQYDVFIVQGKGSRRWQVGLPGKYESHRPHPDLGQITEFEPVIDQVLQTGDILYIPANHPHNGVAAEACFNYSIGFRAPSQQEMLSAFADFTIDQNALTNRYTDSNLQPRQFSGQINKQEQARFKQLMLQAIDSDVFDNWLPSFLSQSKVLVEPELNEHDLNTDDIQSLVHEGCCLYRAPGVKPVFLESTLAQSDSFSFYIEGQEFIVPIEEEKLVKTFLCEQTFDLTNKKSFMGSFFFHKTLTTLINSGYWFLE